MIKLSVCVPMFRAKHCGWIALESLIRQEDINFEWELIIAEEKNYSPFTKSRIVEYKKKLEEVGCVKIKYFSLNHWERLSNKIVFMASKSSKSSKIYASNAADLYSPPKRLKTQYNIFMRKINKNKSRISRIEQVDLYSNARTIVYDIVTEKYYLNDGLKKLERNRNLVISDGSCRSLRMDVMRHLPPGSQKATSVDSWVWYKAKEYVQRKNKRFVHFLEMSSDNWKYGLNVNGLNNITKNIRQTRAKGKKRPFYIIDCPIDIRDTIPHEILDRLKDSKKYAKTNIMSQPKWVPHKRI